MVRLTVINWICIISICSQRGREIQMLCKIDTTLESSLHSHRYITIYVSTLLSMKSCVLLRREARWEDAKYWHLCPTPPLQHMDQILSSHLTWQEGYLASYLALHGFMWPCVAEVNVQCSRGTICFGLLLEWRRIANDVSVFHMCSAQNGSEGTL